MPKAAPLHEIKPLTARPQEKLRLPRTIDCGA